MKPWQPLPSDGPSACITDTAARDCALVVTIVAHHHGVERRNLFATSRCTSSTAIARQVAMYLCHTMLHISLSAVGRYFGRHRTTVAHACVMVEDQREEGSPKDRELLRLEAEIERQLRVGQVGTLRRFQTGELRHG